MGMRVLFSPAVLLRRVARQNWLWAGVLLLSGLIPGVASRSAAWAGIPTPAMSILLVPAIADAPAAQAARGVFYRATKSLTIPRGLVMLASSPDGSGALCTDDEVRLHLFSGNHTVTHWSHRFSSTDRRSIVCLPPRQLEIPDGPGEYRVHIELEDRDPPTYSSRPYYLVIAGAPPQPPPDPTARQPSLLPARPAAATPVRVAHATRAPQRPAVTLPVPAPIRQAGDQVTQRPAPPSDVAPDGRAGEERASGSWGLVIVAGGLSLACAMLVLGLLRRRARRNAFRTPAGVIYLYDQETHEACTAVLGGGRAALVIQRHPLALAPQAAVAPDRVVGQIQPGDAGPRLFDPAAGKAAVRGILMRHAEVYALAGGVVTVQYHAAALQLAGVRTGGARR